MNALNLPHAIKQQVLQRSVDMLYKANSDVFYGGWQFRAMSGAACHGSTTAAQPPQLSPRSMMKHDPVGMALAGHTGALLAPGTM